jgi:hypothetical protein
VPPRPVTLLFNRLGELRDRSYQNQQDRASGLTLLTAAIELEKLSDNSQARASLLAIRRLTAAYTKASKLSGKRS